MGKVALITGDRNWTDKRLIQEWLKRLDITAVIEGGARGADALAGQSASELGIEVAEVPADWDKHGRAAGPIRNAEMLKLNPDIVLAFHGNLRESKGTKDMVRRANKAGVPVWLFGGAPDYCVTENYHEPY
jgi:hypothetical protein